MKRTIAILLICCVLASNGDVLAQDAGQEARQLYRRAMELYNSGRYNDALPLAERAASMSAEAQGPEHSDVALTLNGLALIHVARGAYARAEPLYQRAFEIYSKLSTGPYSEATRNAATGNVASTLNNLAELYKSKGDYQRAEPFYQRALEIQVKQGGPERESVATTLNNLGDLYRSKGDFARAEPLYQRALSIYTKVSGAEHPDVALVLNNLGALQHYRGDYARAEQLYLRALTIRQKVLGSGHPDVATTISNLAELCRAKGDLARAEQLHLAALPIYVKAAGTDNPEVVTSLNNLAGVYLLRGELARAEPVYQRALAIAEKTLGAEHPQVALMLNALGAVYDSTGDYARAEQFYLRSLAIREKTLGASHPWVATTLTNLGDLYSSKGDTRRAVQFTRRGLEVRERNLNVILTAGSEEQKQSYLNTLSGETSSTVSLHVRDAPADEQAAQLAFTTILRRKGRALDAMSDQLAVLRQRAMPQDSRVLDQLTAARSQLATLQVSGAGRFTPAERQSEISRLTSVVAQLEDLVSRRSAEFRALIQPVTIEAVSQSLPAGAALVEIASYRPFNHKAAKTSERFGPPQYVAYVLKRNEATPRFVELGATESIDADVSKLRAALQDPKRPVKPLARALDERVMKPVRSLLGSARHIFVSADGTLNLIPFAALIDESGKYLIESYTISYLTSGRDLLRLQLPRESRTAPLVMGDPVYDLRTVLPRPVIPPPQPGTADGPNAANRRSIDFAAVNYSPLAGTGEEARALKAIMPAAVLLLKQQATEAALKQVRAPRVLHVATHGFFLPDQANDDDATDARALIKKVEAPASRPATTKSQSENPLLRSGLILAGVNQQQSGPGEDGVLTALETAGLDLWGTQLVVLSACETGLGDVRTGAGVYGLRRALVLAGSETQMMSLWSVSDNATRDLMMGFYTRLQAGEGRAEALRNVQLAMLGSAADSPTAHDSTAAKVGARPVNWSHPYFWAPFIQSGAWTSMNASTR